MERRKSRASTVRLRTGDHRYNVRPQPFERGICWSRCCRSTSDRCTIPNSFRRGRGEPCKSHPCRHCSECRAHSRTFLLRRSRCNVLPGPVSRRIARSSSRTRACSRTTCTSSSAVLWADKRQRAVPSRRWTIRRNRGRVGIPPRSSLSRARAGNRTFRREQSGDRRR
jgi:hypothetical protein